MTPCGKPFCTCCETAYVAGFVDGLSTGLVAGYDQGHRDGYVAGYLDAEANIPPLPGYQPTVEVLRMLEDTPKRLDCGCYGNCVCDLLHRQPLPTVRVSCYISPQSLLPKSLDALLGNLPCGCRSVCTCYLPKWEPEE